MTSSMGIAAAQTLATGDSRTVVEPTIPTVCTTLSAQQAIVSGAPASETTLDTTRIQAALTACTSGKVVELASSGANVAFLSGPLVIPTGVGLLVDGGVTLFGSRNPVDYQTSSTELCGTYGPLGNGCNALITFTTNGTGSGLYGYGVIDGRGGATMLGGPNAGETWWTNADNADGIGGQDNPLLVTGTTNNLTLYKITLRNSPQFHFGWHGTGLTIWGVKISAPYTAHNTDGIDPTGTNITITNSSVSDGDDNIAVGASSASANVTISNVNTYSGHGISVGSYTGGGLTNYLVKNVNLAGTAADSNASGLRLKSAADRGGLLDTLTYQNVCIRDTRYPIQFNPLYDTNAGTSIPQFKNIVLQNVHVLTPTATKYPYSVQLQGYDANHLTTVTFNNLVFDQLTASQISPAPQDISIALQGNVYPAFLQSLTGTGVSYSGTATASSNGGVSTCASAFPYIVGELYLSTSTATNLQSTTIADTGSITLNAMLQPAMSQTTYAGTSGTWTGVAAPSNPVSFYDGSTLVGTGTLGANGTLASLTINQPSAGTHTYTAQYAGDSNYGALTFGSTTATVLGPAVASTTVVTAPATSVYGAPVALSATVTGTGGTPSGTVTFFDGSTSLGSATLSSGKATFTPGAILAGGNHTLKAVYNADLVFMGSTSTTAALTVTTATPSTAAAANPTSITVNGTTTLSATVTGVSGAATPTGKVTFTDGSIALGAGTLAAGTTSITGTLTTLGNRSIQACYSGDSNYTSACGTVTVTTTPLPTKLTLTFTPVTIYTGGVATLTGTLTPVVAGSTVTFSSGTSTLGSAVTDSTGTASVSYTAGAVGTVSIYASSTAAGNDAAATSTTQTLNVVNPFSLTATPTTITVTHGTSGNAVFNVVPGGSFVGAVSLKCSTTVSYLHCLLPSSVVGVSGLTPTQVTSTIGVDVTSSAARSSSSTEFAWLAFGSLGLLGLGRCGRRARRIQALAVLAFLGVALVCVTGCASGPNSTAPSGSQSVTITGTGNGLMQTLVITVNIN